MLAKIKAALDARTDEAMMICARTDVFALEGQDAAIRRCQLFMEAGADMAKPQGVDAPEGIAEVMRSVPGPYIATLSQAAASNKTTPAELESLGVPAATLPSLALFAAARAVRESLSVLQATRSLEPLQGRLLPLQDYYKIVRLDEQQAREKLWDDTAADLTGASKIGK